MNGHDPETLDVGAPEQNTDQETGWIDAGALYITDEDGKADFENLPFLGRSNASTDSRNYIG